MNSIWLRLILAYLIAATLMARSDWYTLCTSSLNLGHLVRLHGVVFYWAPSLRLFGSFCPALSNTIRPRQPALLCDITRQNPHQPGEQMDHCGKAFARFSQPLIKIA